MKCPICKKEVAFGDPYMPFCSERCRLLDLGNWVSERYVISKPMQSGSQPESEEEKHAGRDRGSK